MKISAAKVFISLASIAGLLGIGFPQLSHAVPSFARQTGMTCQACHTVFPELTPFGRAFKLNAYQIDNLPQVQGITSSKEYELLLNQVPPLSLMFQTSYTKTKSAVPDSNGTGDASQNGQILFPQQASLFYAGRVAPGLGAFVQITYDSEAGNVHWDNTEIRYARQVTLASQSLTWGLTMNNNPTVQDPWNSTPAWQTPFDQKSSAAPTPGTATAIDGLLAGRVAGLTGYLWWANSVYLEYGLYRSAPQAQGFTNGAGPLDSTTQGGVLVSNAPYWRIAYEHQWNRNSLSVGAYGIDAQFSLQGQSVGLPADRFRDTALDGQYQYIGDDHIVSLQTTYIKERQNLDATFAAGGSQNAVNYLNTFRLAGSYYFRRTYGASAGYFSTTGSADAMLYLPAVVTGFANGSPNSKGWIGELDYVPWQNVKLAAQYVAYQKFNGESSNYDGGGRNANANNTFYLLAWLAF